MQYTFSILVCQIGVEGEIFALMLKFSSLYIMRLRVCLSNNVQKKSDGNGIEAKY